MAKISPRQELGAFACNGNLRSHLEINANGLSEEAIELLINITIRYCEPPRRKKKNRKITY